MPQQIQQQMRGRADKAKEYYLQGRQSTAKKGRRNANDSLNSNSLSTSHHNYHKYELHDQIETHKLPTIHSNQLAMMLRCLNNYCHNEKERTSEEHTNMRYGITSNLLKHLKKNYRIVGNPRQIRQNEELIKDLTPPPERACQRCDQLGTSCSLAHAQYLQTGLPEQIKFLEKKLIELEHQAQFAKQRIQEKREYTDAEAYVRQLREVVALQAEYMQQMQGSSGSSLSESQLQLFTKSRQF